MIARARSLSGDIRSPRSRPLVVVVATAAVAACAAAGIAGGAWAIAMAIGGAALAAALAIALSQDEDVRFVVTATVGATLGRAGIASVLHLVLLRQNAAGALLSDDNGYVTIASTIARYWHGELSAFPVDPSIVNTYAKSAAGLFFLVGPDIAALKIANTVLSIGAALFVYRIVTLLATPPANRFALAVMLLFPSIVLWSSLALKEAFVLFFATGAAWCVAEFLARPRYRWLAAFVAFSLPLQDTRGYLFTLLVALWPVTLAVSWLARRLSWRPVAVSAVAAILLILNVPAGLAVGISAFADVRAVREQMAENANSAVVEGSRVQAGSEGQQFVVVVPGRTADPDRTPRQYIVSAGQSVVYAQRGTSGVPPPSNRIEVQPGDIVIIQSTGGTFAPTSSAVPTQMVVPQSGSAMVSTSPETSDATTNVVYNIAYLPRGALFVIGAPFPWELLSTNRLVFIPELAFWYAVVVLAFVGLYRIIRSRDLRALYVVAVGLGLAGILSLAEGNLGTLVRHRGMLVPFAVIVASIGAVDAMRILRERSAGRRQRA